jgi:hypothetical protein
MFTGNDAHVRQRVTVTPNEITAYGDGLEQGKSGFTLDLEGGIARWVTGAVMTCHRSHI